MERETRVPLGALRGHELQSVDLHELPLERRGDVVGHRVRAGPRVVRLNLDHGVVHRRQVVHGELQIAEHPEEDHGDCQDRGHDRPADERLGEVHDLPPGFAAGEVSAARGSSTRTFPPGVTASWPSMTNRSPALSP